MKRLLFYFVVLAIVLTGCDTSAASKEGVEVDKPPKMWVEIAGQQYETVLGAYCWKKTTTAECVDVAGAEILLKDKEPIEIEAGETVTFGMDFEPLPNEVHLTQTSNKKSNDVAVTNFTFTAPEEEGVYYYDIGVWWMDESNEDVSNGNAIYAIALKVK
ncbi:hypothetical protein [Ornithinibacillus sp. FSL M8-0202]|uniref:hypothetical protein n=1 Tax=unclassified Ornithinibacillus TaxID=2620869 RepID=UPI0030D4B2D2